MRKTGVLVVTLIILLLAYALGPDPSKPSYNKEISDVPAAAGPLEEYVKRGEARHRLKPGNEAQIVWVNDSVKTMTGYAIVYLHGFSASREEGEPVHRNIARRFGCNLYLSRLAEHGIDTIDAMANLTADKLWESAKEALAIGRRLGRKVILMGTSTGGTLALKLAATYPDVQAIILLSPNVAIRDSKAWLLNNPWGLQIARMVMHSDYVQSKDQRDIFKKYWYSKYRIEAATELQELLETSMNNDVFRRVSQPALLMYYYRDEVHQDSVVSIPAMRSMMRELGTAENRKRSVVVPNAGDHVIGSYVKSKDLKTVEDEIKKFLEEVLHLEVKE